MFKRELAPIEGDQIILRLLERDDLPLTLRWRNQDDIRKWFVSTDIIQGNKHLAWFEHYRELDNDFVFLILAKDLDQQPVGQISLYNINWNSGSAEYGRLIIGHPAARGKGYAKQATILLLDLAFRVLNLDQISLEVKPDNGPAIAIYKSVGFISTQSSNDLMRMTIRRP